MQTLAQNSDKGVALVGLPCGTLVCIKHYSYKKPVNSILKTRLTFGEFY